jgi:hypothetical protein
MSKKLALSLIVLILLASTNIASGQLSIGVKQGDWVQYEVSTTGTPIEGHNIVSAKMEIIEVNDDGRIRANVTTTAQNGTVSIVTRSFNFQEGQVEGWIIIPANLGGGDSFYDVASNQTITVQTEEQQTLLGATRTITGIDVSDRHKEWDKATGVFVATTDYLQNYTVTATAIATNMWSPQILGLDQTVFYAIIVIMLVAVLAVAIFVIFRRRKFPKRAIGGLADKIDPE